MPPVVAGLSDPVEIGRGGFGIVYRAHDERFDREVALKVIRDQGLSDETVARFARECRSLGSLSGHPNIVSIYDAGQTDDGDLFLVMEYLPKGSLAQRVATDGPASPAEVLAWGAALAGALETAHSGGIVHRDVKPENALFSTFGAAKLVDFGIARMRTAFETRSGQVSATLSHAAPEIIGGSPASPSSDVYSLASVLFFALTGSAPFDRPGEESLAPLIARIATAEPPDLREHGVPAPLAAVITQALAKDAGDRPANAAAFGQALQDAAAALSLPIPAVPISSVAPVGNLFEIPLSERATPRMGTVQVGRRREAPPEPTAAVVLPPRRRRLPPLAAAAVILLALVGAGVGVAATWGDGDAAASPGLRLADAVVHTDQGIDVTRDYSISEDRSSVGSSVQLANTTDEAAKVTWFEVVPRELASSVDDVQFSPEPDGSLDDAATAYWVLTLEPGDEQSVSWTAPLPDGAEPSQAYLKEVRQLIDEQRAAQAEETGAKATELEEETGASAPTPVEDPGSLASGEGPATVPGTGGGAAAGGGTAGGGSPANPGGAGTGTVDTGSVGGSVPVPNGGTGGGTTTGGTTGGTGGGTAGGSPAPAPPANRAPTISASNQTSSEQAGVSVTFSASDPDGDGVTWSASGLPPGLSMSGGRVSGTIPYSALSVTSTKNAIQSRGYAVTLTATDSRAARTTKTITWTVRDTHIAMPNYFHKWGCGTASNCDGPGYPNVADLSAQDFNCAVDPAWVDHIVAQSVPAGQVIAWGQRVVYTYAHTSC